MKKGENGGERKKKKLIKNKILTSPARLLLGASSSCARVTERAAMAQLGGRAKSRIWEKAVPKPDGLNLYSLLNYILMHWLLWRCWWDWLGLGRFGVSVPREPAELNPR